jgi:hypothetical protein
LLEYHFVQASNKSGIKTNTGTPKGSCMGTLLRFPSISPTERDPHLQALTHALSGLVGQVNSLQKIVEGSLSVALARIETALADFDEIGHLLPSGEFKARLDLDRAALAAQLDQVKREMVRLGAVGSRKTPT